jgi:poly(3-hydroxybutyrate) depolymerase
VDAGGKEIAYILRLPPTYAPGVPHAVVFGFHGGHENAGQLDTAFDFKAELGDDAILIMPEAPDGSTWIKDAAAQLGYFDAIWSTAQGELCVDVERVFATGYSAGGYFAAILGCERGHVVHAVAPVASRLASIPSGCVGHAGLLMIHGADDDQYPESAIELARETRDVFVAQNGCGQETTPVDPSPCVSYPGCAAGAPVDWCEHDSGHGWPPWATAAVAGFFGF